MPDYSKGKIYTIRNRNDDAKIYVGSTIQPLAVRFAGHKRDCKIEKNMKMKLYVEVNNDWDNWYIELYENYQCNNREELCRREGEIIRLIGTLNSKIAGRDKKQYYFENVDRIKEYRNRNADNIKEQIKQYHIENIENIREQQKQYRIENAEKLKEQKKQYYLENADKLKEQRKQYYIENAEKIKKKDKQYYIQNTDKRKQYRIENAEKIKEQRKQYYLKNKLKQTQ